MDIRRKGSRMTPEEIAALQKQNEEMAAALAAAEAAKGGDDSADELKRLREERAELIAGRDKAKQKAREAEEAKLAEQGEFKTLAEKKSAEAETLAKQLEELNGTISTYKERDEAKLKTLLKDVPENLRETVANNSGTLAEKLELAEKLLTVKPSGPKARPGFDDKTEKDYSELPAKERLAQARANGDI
jgi:hypothetical protein